MSLSAPSHEDHPTVLADWIELKALSSEYGRAEISLIRSIIDISQDHEAEDIGDYDAFEDAIVARVAAEFSARQKIIGEAYPFVISDGGSVLKLRDEVQLGGTVYLFCLIMSHAAGTTILPRTVLDGLVDKARDLFQICATLCAAGWCDGPAISFGWPRPDRTKFSEKLAQVFELFGDGKPRAVPPPAAPQHIKDGGIDVIAWRHVPDRMPGTLYMLGQVASGQNWKEKSVLTDIRVFHEMWFEIRPASPCSGAMFIPFCIDAPPEESGEFTEQERLFDKMRWLTTEFGILFYRYRVAHYAARAQQLCDRSISPIERIDDVPLIQAWIRECRNRLMKATAA